MLRLSAVLKRLRGADHPAAVGPRPHNAFDVLRLVAALMVLVTHQYGALEAPAPFPLGIVGAWGVDIFFSISGYFNAHSLLARKSLLVFLASRALRIYPALILCVLFMVALGAVVTEVPLSDYFSRQTFDFAWRNAGVFNGQRMELPGVFAHNPKSGLNASLWTLPIEGRFYLQLGIAMFVIRYLPGVAAIVAVAAFAAFAVRNLDVVYEVNHMARFGLVFGCGVLIAALERLSRASLALAAGAVIAVMFYALGLTIAALLIGLATTTITIGRMPLPFKLPLDISYGFYLFAFPVQQLTVMWGLSLPAGMAVAMVLTAGLAILSAAAIERPALRLAERFKR